MPCRANRCHRAAARLIQSQSAHSPSQHIWISDDHVSQAFSRFSLAVSLTPKRHGSNVPGPLEARRRSAKRRMVGLAHHQGPAMPDFGSLFGTGPGLAPGSIDVGSLWKPPKIDEVHVTATSFQHQVNPLPAPTPTPPTPTPPTTHTRQRSKRKHARLTRKPQITTAQAIQRCNNLESIIRLHADLFPDGQVPLAFSKAAFEQLLAIATVRWDESNAALQHDQQAILQAHHIEDITAFLQHELNHDDAQNMTALFLWFKDKKLDQSAVANFTTILADKIALANILLCEVHAIVKRLSTELPTTLPKRREILLDAYESLATAIHARLPLYASTDRYQSVIALLEGLSNLVPSHSAARIFHKIYQQLSPSNRGSAVPLVAQCLDQWVRRLNQYSYLQPGHSGESSCTPVVDLVNNLDPRHATNIIINTTARLVVPNPTTTPYTAAPVPLWLYLLRQAPSLNDKSWDHEDCVWSHIYPLLSNHLSPDHLHDHFAALGPVDSARLILRYWIVPSLLGQIELPRAKSLKKPSNTPGHATVSYHILHQPPTSPDSTLINTRLAPPSDLESPQSEDPPPVDTHPSRLAETIQADFEARCATYVPGNGDIVYAPFADLVTILYHHKYRHDYALEMSIKLLLRLGQPKRLYNFAARLNKRSVYIPPSIALSLVQFFIEKDCTRHALRIFRACKNLWPSSCPELIFALIESGPVTTSTLFQILNRSEYSNSLPVALRTEDTNNLSEQRIHLIHNVIWALANSTHHTARESFRRIHDCLRYLVDRRAPLSSLVSRALIQAGVIRPLQEGCWVSTVKFAWILKFVTKFEGEHVATTLDQAIFAWRHELSHEERLRDRERLDHIFKQKREVAWRYRQNFGHDSHRWKRKTAPWRPWLADKGFVKTKEQEQEVKARFVGSAPVAGCHQRVESGEGDADALQQNQTQQVWSPVSPMQ